MRRRKTQNGQALTIVVIAVGLLLLGALGFAIDGATLYGHLQMAQVAADAGAQAGIMSIFAGTNVWTNAFGTATFNCSATDVRTPCIYARSHGFGTSSDTVIVEFPTSVDPGVDPWRTPVSRYTAKVVRV